MPKHQDKYTPPKDGLWFLPLGGAGEIGMNLSLYGTDGKWLMVDCGVSFGDETTPGVDVLMPDITFIEDRIDNLVGMVITHGHEDHLGAIEYLWPKLKCPIYATKFTAGMIRAKLREAEHNNRVKIIEVPLKGSFTLGPFTTEFITVTHSIPESNMLAIHTPQGTVLHTGDWKFDDQPLIGEISDKKRLKELGEKGVLALIGDSTNAQVPGRTGSEASVRNHFAQLFHQFKKRIVVTCFASNIVRMQSALQAAVKNHREVGLVGRSMWRNAEIAADCGYLPEFNQVLSEHDAGFLPPSKALYICTGSQGEPRSALARLSTGDHPELVLEKGDVVIFSSREIPGNEKAIGKIQNQLLELGVQVWTVHDDPGVHVSGHAARDEMIELYQLTRPKNSIPVHGELRHQTAHAAIAAECQVKHSIIPTNGQLIYLGPGPAAVVGEVQHGVMGMDGSVMRRINAGAMSVRKKISYNGAVVMTLVMNRGGQLADDPKISLLGVADEQEQAVIQEELHAAIEEAVETMHKSSRSDDAQVKKVVGNAVRKALNDWHGKKPMAEIHVVRVK